MGVVYLFYLTSKIIEGEAFIHNDIDQESRESIKQTYKYNE